MVPKLLKSIIQEIPLRPGIYIYKNTNGDILYVGKSVRLRDRVKSYFYSDVGTKTHKLVSEIADIEIIETDSEIEALILEAELIREKQPPYNVQWKDGKRYKYIKIHNAKYKKRVGKTKTVDENIWPFVSTTRKIDDPRALYFGPFPEGKTVTDVLRALRKMFPWCSFKDTAKKEREKKPCFNSHIKLCPGICSDSISLKEYWGIMDQLVTFLRGNKKTVLERYSSLMKQAASQNKFETAALYRDLIRKLQYITQEVRDADVYIENPNLIQDIRNEEINALLKKIGIKPMDDTENYSIEGYDISNLGKDFTVASQVTFVGGDPDKNLYRRYKIHSKDVPSDVAAMKEVMTRRVKASKRKNPRNMPDLLLIDGGKAQIATIRSVLESLEDNTPFIGLAKKEETIVIPLKDKKFKEVKLPKNSPAIKLIQRIRDEAHRFAQNYHKHLRSKALISGRPS